MANREENLKKINAELEQLSDEELEKVAGGGSTGHCNPLDKYFQKDLVVKNIIENEFPQYGIRR